MSEDRDKIRKVLAMLEGAKTEGEAQAASLALQRMLAKTGLTVEDLEAGQDIVREYSVAVAKSASAAWQLDLAAVLAENLRCAAYEKGMRDGTRRIVFIGAGDDGKVAAECLIAAISAAERCYRRRCREIRAAHPDIDPTRAAARKGYYLGFIGGLDQAFGDQVAGDEELALALQMPQAVREALEAHRLGQARRTRRSVVWEETYTKGREDGYRHGKGTGKAAE